MNEEYIFTFLTYHGDSMGLTLKNKYVVISGDFNTTRDKMCEVRGSEWGFQYITKEKAGVYEYDLEEITLEDTRI